MEKSYKITGLGPLIFGDGRPFSNQGGSLNLQGLDLPFPSTLASSLTAPLLGNEKDETWKHNLNHMLVRGPILKVGESLCFPAPADGVFLKKLKQKDQPEDKKTYLASMRPGIKCEGTNAPKGIEMLATIDMKQLELDGYERTKSSVRFLTLNEMVSHLIGKKERGNEVSVNEVSPVKGILSERRVGVGIDYATKGSKKGELYTTNGKVFGQTIRKNNSSDDDEAPLEPGHQSPLNRNHVSTELAFSVSVPNEVTLPDQALFELGGERHKAIMKKIEGDFFKCPDDIKDAVSNSQNIRLTLATPAQFNRGWYPKWLETGECPWLNLQFKLISACVGRRQAVSGWGISPKNFGPKPVTWLVPAGSTYFLELINPPADYANKIAEAWLQAVSDDPKFRRRGFGLALWGTW